jgi:hypothetical protein
MDDLRLACEVKALLVGVKPLGHRWGVGTSSAWCAAQRIDQPPLRLVCYQL